MKTIFETFKKSVHDPVFYQTVASAPLSVGFRYYIKFVFILSLLMTVALSILLIPQGVAFVKKDAPDYVQKYFPKELSVHIEKGIASANVQMPYFVTLKSMTGENAASTSVQNMLVIDTTKDFDKKTFEEYKTYALLTNTDIVTRNDNGQITIQSLRGTPTVTVSQETLLSWVSNIQNYLGTIVALGILMTFIIIMFGYIAYLIPLLVFALVPKAVAYVKNTPLSYASAYKMSLYAIIPALALKTLLNILGVFFLPEYFTLLVFMLVIAVNMRDTEKPTLFNN